MTLVLVEGWKWWEDHAAYDLINGTTWSWTRKNHALSPPASLAWLRVTEPNQLGQKYGGRRRIKRIYIEMLTSAEKTIDTSIWKGVCTNMLDIFLIIWLQMSNILTSLIPCFIERCQNGTFSARIQFWKYQIIFFLVFQMVYLVSIS